MQKDIATLQEASPVQDTEGSITNDWVNVINISGTKLPITSEIAIKKYGYYENVQYQFFTKESHSKLLAGNRLVIGNENLMIGHVADYKKIRVVLLKTDIEGRDRYE